MGIILGYLCVICFILLAVKAITHRCHLTKIDRTLMKIHKPVSAAMLLLSVVHLIAVIPVLKNRAWFVNVSGIIIIVLIPVLIALCHMMKKREKRMQWHRIMTVILLIGVAVHMVVYFVDFAEYQNKISSIEIDNVDLSQIADGSYEGEYDAGYIYAKVRVEVKDGKIESVTLLEHRNERGEPAEIITDDILEQQKIDVDAISGATNSSKVIQKAVENAIRHVK